MVTKHNKKNYLIPYESIMQKSYLINQSIQNLLNIFFSPSPRPNRLKELNNPITVQWYRNNMLY